jgi:hypothetical protein
MDFSKIIQQTAISHLLVAIIAAVIGGASVIFLKPDNAVEQAAEDVIKQETGFDVDLTPD